MQTVTVDCSGITSTDEFWQCYVDAARPEEAASFGRNLDALWDAVEGGGPGWPGEVRLVFKSTENLESGLLEGLRRIARETTHIVIEVH